MVSKILNRCTQNFKNEIITEYKTGIKGVDADG